LLIAVLAAVVVLAIARLFIGPSIRGLDEQTLAVIMRVRLDRVSASIAIGACLAVSGVVLQSLLRNPLASPDLIGPSSGASLAVVGAAYVGLWLDSAVNGAGSAGAAGPVLRFALYGVVPALLGALGALAVVYALASWSPSRRRIGPNLDPGALVLAGVMVSVVCGAAVSLLDHIAFSAGLPARVGGSGAAALLGSVRDDLPGWQIYSVVTVGALLCVAVSAKATSLDALVLGDDEARSVGLSVGRERRMLFILAGGLAALAVLLAGPIAFVGLLGPHVARLVLGGTLATSRSHHRTLVVFAALCGAGLMLTAESAARLLDFGSGRLPTGVLTALIGGPAFVVLLWRRRY